MKKFISILTILSIVMSFCFQTVSAAIIGDAVADTDVVLSSVLTDSLRERLSQIADDDIIPVTIELKDNIDLKGVEQKAVARAKISSNEMAALNANTVSLTDAENESVQLNALRIYDRISKERNSVLLDYYSAKNNDVV